MTSLQQTAMLGGDTTAKTASYVLVAADAGTTVAMDAAGATTITVNTGLFSAGDTVFIQNWGAGTCTVTAGTATVNTHGSLALSQYEGGTLYFTSASAAIFFDISQTSGMTNPLTTTGDTIYSSSGSTPARLGIGTAGQVLTVNSGATAPEWATASSGGMTLISTTSLSGASVTLSSIPQTYKSLYLVLSGVTTASGNGGFRILPNNVNNLSDQSMVRGGTATDLSNGTIRLDGGADHLGSVANNAWAVTIDDYTSATAFKPYNLYGFWVVPAPADRTIIGGGAFTSTTAITSLVIDHEGNTMNAGTVLLYGVS